MVKLLNAFCVRAFNPCGFKMQYKIVSKRNKIYPNKFTATITHLQCHARIFFLFPLLHEKNWDFDYFKKFLDFNSGTFTIYK